MTDHAQRAREIASKWVNDNGLALFVGAGHESRLGDLIAAALDQAAQEAHESDVKWVHKNFISSIRGPESEYAPVLTLDQVEAWLKGEMDECRKDGCYGMALLTSLLAQVQAWKASVQ
jgi:hypothetical protein